MDRRYLDLHLTVDRYLQGTLDERELAAFEERLVWDQALLDEVDLAERLRGSLQASMADQEGMFAAADGRAGSRLWRWWSVPQYAAAASFVLGVGLTAMFLLNLAIPVDGGRANESRPTEIVPLFAVRGAAVQTIVLDERAWTVLLVDVTDDYDRYRVTVRQDRDGAQPVWMQDDLRPTYPQALAVGMPAATIPPSRYVLVLEGASIMGSGGSSWEHVQDLFFQTRFPEPR
ncbi:MAG: hypothetical protein ACREQ8_10925 [Woeseiaceae bacterium]